METRLETKHGAEMLNRYGPGSGEERKKERKLSLILSHLI
jgi:hypothetical protein